MRKRKGEAIWVLGMSKIVENDGCLHLPRYDPTRRYVQGPLGRGVLGGRPLLASF